MENLIFHKSIECKPEHMKFGKCVPFKEVKKYHRLDAEFYTKLIPEVKQFFKNHAVDNQGKIYSKTTPYDDKYIDMVSERTMVLLYALIKHHSALESIRTSIRQMEADLAKSRVQIYG